MLVYAEKVVTQTKSRFSPTQGVTMKPFSVILLCALLAACADTPIVSKQSRIAAAQAEAELQGNSGPLYDLYVACLNQTWQQQLEISGTESVAVFDAGVMACGDEITALCEYYANSDCYQDAMLSNRSLYSLMLYDYRINKAMRSE